jgi:hypothetical protein
MRLNETRSAGEGLERSCQGTVARWRVSTRPAGGVELFSAWFAGEAYQKHRHDTYAMVMSRSVWKLSAVSSGSPRGKSFVQPTILRNPVSGAAF